MSCSEEESNEFTDTEDEEEIIHYSDIKPPMNLFAKRKDDIPIRCEPECNGKKKNGCTGTCKEPPPCLCERDGWDKNSCPMHS